MFKCCTRHAFALVFSLLFCVSLPALADEIRLRDGSVVRGTILTAEAGQVTIETGFAGVLLVNSAEIASMFTDQEVTVLMHDGRVIENQRIASRDDAMVMMNDSLETVLLSVEQVDQINPEPWELGKGYKWTGGISTAIQLEKGNTDTQELDFDVNTAWRSLRDRYFISGIYELDEANGERNKDKWRWRNKYDYFLEDVDNYVGGLLSFEGDDIANLDLRTVAGPYLGRQFFHNNYLSVQGEVGLVYVDQQYSMEPNNRYPGGNWAFHLTSDYLGGSTTIYLDHDGVMNFEATDELLLNTVLGLNFPIYGRLQAAAELRLKYDGSVGADTEESDRTFRVKLGYTW